MGLLLKVIMTTYVIVGISLLFAMLANVIFWKSEKVDDIIAYATESGEVVNAECILE